jgi:TolB protein
MKTTLKIIVILSLILGFASKAHARIYIPIDQPSERKFPIAIAELKREGGSGKAAREIPEIIRNDLKLSGYFLVIPPAGFKKAAKKEGSKEGEINFGYWKSINANALVKGTVSKEKGKDVITIRLFDPFMGKMLMGKRYIGKKKQWRAIAHRFSDEIMSALTGIPGVFNTRIAYSTVTKKGKEITVMDMDGENNKRLTKNKSINISPSWSSDGSQLVFTSYVNGNPDLYLMKVGGKRIHRITDGPGGKITPSWSPNGHSIAMASSASGISNIYRMSTNGSGIKRLTNGKAIDISPSWSPNAQELVFASERAGGLHLFKMNSSGGDMKRLSFVGYQNDMPSWSPMGEKIAFAGRMRGKFDVFIVNTDGSNIQRLTIGAGSNEHPSFSPDGRFITFSSTRTGSPAIFIMRRDGSNQTRVSEGNGILPSWGPRT